MSLALYAGCKEDPADTSCTGADDCFSEDTCVVGTCESQICVYTPVTNNPACVTACDDDGQCEDSDDCTENVCNQLMGVCEFPPIPGCGGDNPVYGDINLDDPETGNPYASGFYCTDAAFNTYIEAEQAKEDAIAIGACAEQVFDAGPDVDGTSIGDLVFAKDGTTLIDIPPSPPGNNYFGFQFSVDTGDLVDVQLTGSTDVTAATFDNALHVPARPVFSDVAFDNADVIDATFTYTATASTDLFITFNYLSGQNGVTMRCRLDPNGTTFTIPAADFAKIGPSGQMRATSANEGRITIVTPSGKRDLYTSATAGTKSASYTKAP